MEHLVQVQATKNSPIANLVRTDSGADLVQLHQMIVPLESITKRNVILQMLIVLELEMLMSVVRVLVV